VDDALILFVDDKPFNADLFVRVLRRCGYTNELVRVGDGVEALDSCTVGRTTPVGTLASSPD